MEPIACRACFAPLQPDDPHTLCPSCLGVSHLREALSDPCVHCATIPFASRQDRLASVLVNEDAMLSSSGASPARTGTKRCSSRHANEPAPKRKVGALRSRLERLEALVTQLQSHQLPVSPKLGADPADLEPVDEDDSPPRPQTASLSQGRLLITLGGLIPPLARHSPRRALFLALVPLWMETVCRRTLLPSQPGFVLLWLVLAPLRRSPIPAPVLT